MFKVAQTSIKYLGFHIGKHTASMYSLNYPPLINRIVGELEAWQNLPLSLNGRCHLVNDKKSKTIIPDAYPALPTETYGCK